MLQASCPAIEPHRQPLCFPSAIMPSFRFPGASTHRALVTAEGNERSRDSSIDSFRRSDEREASTRYLIVLTCSTGGYVKHGRIKFSQVLISPFQAAGCMVFDHVKWNGKLQCWKIIFCLLIQTQPFLITLGLPESLTAMVWAAAPLCGFLVQPYVGGNTKFLLKRNSLIFLSHERSLYQSLGPTSTFYPRWCAWVRGLYAWTSFHEAVLPLVGQNLAVEY